MEDWAYYRRGEWLEALGVMCCVAMGNEDFEAYLYIHYVKSMAGSFTPHLGLPI